MAGAWNRVGRGGRTFDSLTKIVQQQLDANYRPYECDAIVGGLVYHINSEERHHKTMFNLRRELRGMLTKETEVQTGLPRPRWF